VERLYGSDNHDICCENSIVYSLEAQRRQLKERLSVSDWLRIVTTNENGKFSAEEVYVSNNLLSMDPVFFQNATIQGLLFHSRGSWKRETSRPTKEGYGKEKPTMKGSGSSELRNNFRDKANYSSWCIFQHQEYPKHYAQINAFFQIQVGDKSLDGLMVASVTSRIHHSHNKFNFVRIPIQGSLNTNTLFVSIKDIFPTRIATIPFAKDGIAINIRKNNVLRNNYFTCKYSTSFSESVIELYMFILHPERLTFRLKY
jgi:hypothetical protein